MNALIFDKFSIAYSVNVWNLMPVPVGITPTAYLAASGDYVEATGETPPAGAMSWIVIQKSAERDDTLAHAANSSLC